MADESALVRRAISGDFEAFGVLYQTYVDAIYRYVYFRTGGPQDAEDLTGQVFLKAWEALPAFRPRGEGLSRWLYRIAHNIVIDHYRRSRHVAATPLAALAEKDLALAGEQETLIERVLRAEQHAALAQAIARLDDDEQQVLVLRFIEGLSHAEVAGILQKSAGACRAIQHRALLALNQMLADFREDGADG